MLSSFISSGYLAKVGLLLFVTVFPLYSLTQKVHKIKIYNLHMNLHVYFISSTFCAFIFPFF